MLRTVSIRQLKPNPFRRLDEYPILREKVDALKESIAQTGFWGTIVGRPKGEDVEIAFGHHRLVALQEGLGSDGRVEVIVRDLSNEDMLRMMANENQEEWGSSASVEIETIRSVIEAYGKGLITLPPIPRNTPKIEVRELCEGSRIVHYTKASVAEFLGWTSKANENGLRPNFACETAFKALDMIDAGYLTEAEIKGLMRTHLEELVRGQSQIRDAETRAAKQEEEEATRASEIAANAEDPAERQVYERQAAIYTEQAQRHKTAAAEKPKRFGKEAAEMFRGGSGKRDVRKRAEELKSVVEQPIPEYSLDKLASRIARRLEGFARDEILTGDFKILKSHIADPKLSATAINGLRQSFALLITTLERMQGKLQIPVRSHTTETGSNNGRKSIADGRPQGPEA